MLPVDFINRCRLSDTCRLSLDLARWCAPTHAPERHPAMAELLYRLGRFSARRPWTVLVAWLAVVSFGLFGDEGVFRREATGAAQIVANRFGGDPVVVKYNTKTGGSATVETLATTLQAEAKKMNGESDILFLILTSHGSRDGLAVVAGRLAETLKPSHLSEMLGRTGVRNKVVIISACYSGVFIPRLADADTLVITAADANQDARTKPSGSIAATPFSMLRSVGPII